MRTRPINVSTLAAAILASLILIGCSRERLGPPPAGTHKRASTAISYRLDKIASDAMELAVRESFQLWSDATKFKFSYEGKSRGTVARDGKNFVVFLTRWPSELPIGAAAWTQIYLNTSGDIAEADILLNAQAFSFTTRREAKAGSLYIEDVLAREIGRSLGLDLGQSGVEYRKAAPGDSFEPGIDPVEMAAYLSLYATGPQ